MNDFRYAFRNLINFTYIARQVDGEGALRVSFVTHYRKWSSVFKRERNARIFVEVINAFVKCESLLAGKLLQ